MYFTSRYYYFYTYTFSCCFKLILDPEKQISIHDNEDSDTAGLSKPTAQHHNNGHSIATAGMYYDNRIIILIYLVPFSKGVPSALAELTLQDVTSQAGLQRLDILDQECSPEVLLSLAKHCVDQKLIGLYLNLSNGDIAAVDGDNRTVDEKRVGLLRRWKDQFAFKATYLLLIKALLACGWASEAIDACKTIVSGK